VPVQRRQQLLVGGDYKPRWEIGALYLGIYIYRSVLQAKGHDIFVTWALFFALQVSKQLTTNYSFPVSCLCDFNQKKVYSQLIELDYSERMESDPLTYWTHQCMLIKSLDVDKVAKCNNYDIRSNALQRITAQQQRIVLRAGKLVRKKPRLFKFKKNLK